jgi:acyl-CoA synthetase (AMP-forming)/AMP-acid ligase II
VAILRAGAAIAPEAVAIVSLADSVTYRQFMRIALTTARIVAARVPPGAAVACLLPRTPKAIAALMGCLISGRVCLIVELNNPAQRLSAMLANAAPALLLVAEAPDLTTGIATLTLDEVLAETASAPDADSGWQPDFTVDPDAPSCVHFTSGSSGHPKGIVLSRRSTLYRALEGAHIWGLTRHDRVLAPSAHGSSAGIAFLIGVLARGARFVLCDVRREGAGAVLRLVEAQRVNVAAISPPILRLLFSPSQAVSAFRHLRILRISGAALSRADARNWRAQLPPGCPIWHGYASTEALVVAMGLVPPDDRGPEPNVSAGVLRPTHEFALVAPDGTRAAPGEPGELYVRGPLLALGEWHQGGLIPGNLQPDPNRPGWRIFRTGDLLRVRADGLIQVLGRTDRQVNLNGTRVEPAEIEAILRAEPGVSDAVVVMHDDGSLRGFLAAPAADAETLLKAVRHRLADTLPLGLCPSRLTVLPHLPMLPSGKLDIAALASWSDSGAAPGQD